MGEGAIKYRRVMSLNRIPDRVGDYHVPRARRNLFSGCYRSNSYSHSPKKLSSDSFLRSPFNKSLDGSVN